MGLSFSELCCLFCCPPCPSKIAAKLAFLPPEPTYSFEDEDATGSKQKLVLYDKAEWQYSEREKVKWIIFFGVKNCAILFRAEPDCKNLGIWEAPGGQFLAFLAIFGQFLDIFGYKQLLSGQFFPPWRTLAVTFAIGVPAAGISDYRPSGRASRPHDLT